MATLYQTLLVRLWNNPQFDRKRLHSTLGYKSLVRFLVGWISTQQDEKLIA